ncbi:MAG: NAD(+) synthase [Clostridiales bacterium]|jgi:NAD+ synthase (glutamine-hydrolysing)|nr:NAD(+) synthase [Clostridiales bacterium]
MKDGFIKVAAASPEISVADCFYNRGQIKAAIKKAADACVDILVLPELCVTGYTCGDLFYQDALQRSALEALEDIRAFTAPGKCADVLVFLGLPVVFRSKIYNAAAAVKGGVILGLTPKSYLPNYNEFYDKRQFAAGLNVDADIEIGGVKTPFSARLLYESGDMPGLRIAAEICEDLWVMSPPSVAHAQNGATVIVNLSASNETVGKAEYRRSLVAGQSARLLCAYIYASAGEGESTGDLVFGGHNIIAENGVILAEKKPFADFGNGGTPTADGSKAEAGDARTKSGADSESCGSAADEGGIRFSAEKSFTKSNSGEPAANENKIGVSAKNSFADSDDGGLIISEIDVSALNFERSKLANYGGADADSGYRRAFFGLKKRTTALTRAYSRHPFVPDAENELLSRAELILTMQSRALKKRLSGGFKAVIGVSGGLDSALALLVAVRAVKMLKRPLSDVIGITMPCFGTSDETRANALALIDALGADAAEIDIRESVSLHLNDIAKYRVKTADFDAGGNALLTGISDKKKYRCGAENTAGSETFDTAYENAQARERTQALMDVANSVGGIVVGTGDLSELALGWCTYNGDHMSMYAVNSSVPKTLVKRLVRYEAARLGGGAEAVLTRILDTPISPELLPLKDGKIAQRTEDVIGSYELHDFFLYYTVRAGFSPSKILRIAEVAFSGVYGGAVLKKWLGVFIKRFFANQFKRNCVPDGVKVGSVSLSPRGDFRMPSDASAAVWLNEIF